jgi:broad specificity phosphatase PhoE
MAEKPQFILVMRHAEKSADPADQDLTLAGEARATALAKYIPDTFGEPDFIFAAAISKHSARPYETVKPLSKRTGVPIDSTLADQDYAVLAHDLLSDTDFAGKRIVVCWHHGNIPSLMHALGAASGDYPDPWDPSVFNLILRIDYSVGGPSVKTVIEPF